METEGQKIRGAQIANKDTAVVNVELMSDNASLRQKAFLLSTSSMIFLVYFPGSVFH